MNIDRLIERLQEIKKEQEEKGYDLNKNIIIEVDTDCNDYPHHINNCKIVGVDGFGGVITINVDAPDAH